MPRPAIIEDDTPSIAARLEASFWGLLCRVGIRVMRIERLVAVLDRIPHRHTVASSVTVPTSRHFRGAGACLSRTLARSQFLRMRGASSRVAIGVAGSVADFDAHAWLEPLDPPERHVAVHSIAR